VHGPRHDAGNFEPYKPEKTAGRDIVRPDVESFLLAIKICQDQRLPLPARALGVTLLLTRAFNYESPQTSFLA